MIQKFLLHGQKPLLKTPIFTVSTKKYIKSPENREFNAFVIDSLDWVNIIAITDNQKVVMIKQFRFGTDTIEWEIPGGIIEQGENPLVAAKRELEEETGFQSNNWLNLGVVNSNPAIQSNKCFTFLALNAKPTGRINFDPDEDIEQHLINIAEIKEFIRNGKITNTYILAAFFWYFLSKEGI